MTYRHHCVRTPCIRKGDEEKKMYTEREGKGDEENMREKENEGARVYVCENERERVAKSIQRTKRE